MLEKVSSRQLILLITISRITTILTVMPTIYMSPANQDTWIVILLSFFYTILFCSPLLFLGGRFNNSTMIGYMKKIFGIRIGTFIGILYGVFFSIIAIIFSYVTVQMIRASFLTETKPIVTIIFIMISCTYITYKGVGCISKTVEILVPTIISIIIVFCILGFNNIDLTVFLPIFKDSTFLEINAGAIQLSLIFIDIYLLAMIVPELENKKEINKIFIKAVIYSLLLVLGTVVATQGSLGIEQAKHSNFPFLTYIRRIRIYATFERIESLYILMWILAMIIKVTIYIYVSIKAFKEIFKTKNKNTILYIVAASVAITTYYIAEYKPILLEIKSISFTEYIIYFTFKTFVPLIAIIIYFIRRKSFDKQERLSN